MASGAPLAATMKSCSAVVRLPDLGHGEQVGAQAVGVNESAMAGRADVRLAARCARPRSWNALSIGSNGSGALASSAELGQVWNASGMAALGRRRGRNICAVVQP